MSCDIPKHQDAIETERLTYLDLSFDKFKLLSSINLELPRMEIKIRKNYLFLAYDYIANGALPPSLTSSFQQDNSAGKLPYLPFKTSSTKSYLSLVVFLSTEKVYSSFPRLNNLEFILSVNTLLLHGLNPRPSLYSILAKNHLNCLQNLLLESLFL